MLEKLVCLLLFINTTKRPAESNSFNGLKGLKNNVNTCYLNSALQILLKCEEACGLIKEYKWENAFIDTFKKFLNQFKIDDIILVDPCEILKCIQDKKNKKNKTNYYDDLKEDDAMACFEDIITLLSEEIVKDEEKYFSDLFLVKYNEKLTCKICGYEKNSDIKTHFIHYFLTSFNLNEFFLNNNPPENITCENCCNIDEIKTKQKAYNIKTRSSKFLIKKKIKPMKKAANNNNSIDDKKPTGKMKTETIIFHFPKYLCINLIDDLKEKSRLDLMSGKSRRGNREKPHQENKNQIPETLYFSDKEYTLAGSILHISLNRSGHFYAKIKKDEVWVYCNDDKIKSADNKKMKIVNRDNTVFLLYIRK